MSLVFVGGDVDRIQQNAQRHFGVIAAFDGHRSIFGITRVGVDPRGVRKGVCGGSTRITLAYQCKSRTGAPRRPPPARLRQGKESPVAKINNSTHPDRYNDIIDKNR